MIEFRPIPYVDPFSWFSCFEEKPGTLFLDNASTSLGIGQYSYLLWNPFLEFTAQQNRCFWNTSPLEVKGNPLEIFFQKMKEFSSEKDPTIPPFQGGAVGFFAYDLAWSLERLPDLKPREHSFPDMQFYFYDHGLSFDTLHQKAWIFRQSFCSDSCDELMQQVPSPHKTRRTIQEPKKITIQSNFTQAEYLKVLEKTKSHLHAGDIFQANISQRFRGSLPLAPRDLYARLRAISPAPYAAYLDFGSRKILSSSPESFLLRQGEWIHTHPIKGTRKRGKTPEEDEFLKKQLLGSEKDRAELTMIIDLSRNDLGRVCQYGSVRVHHLSQGGIVLETHPTVYHLVSHIEGKLWPISSHLDVLKACFPGGSITGAPKIRAMEIIEDLEPTKRGVYTGTYGWIGFDQDLQLAMGIRLLQIEDDQFSFQVGGGIVIDSDPEEEYQETLIKARGILKALQG
ncbi:MAG: aminodeoxychorismate synthase component I [Planctomycetota bacterium]